MIPKKKQFKGSGMQHFQELHLTILTQLPGVMAVLLLGRFVEKALLDSKQPFFFEVFGK